MRLDPHPIFRKVIIPWYDSSAVCMLTISAMLVVFVFGIIGIFVISDNEKYQDHLWVPAGLVSMSGFVMFSITLRLIKRYFRTEKE